MSSPVPFILIFTTYFAVLKVGKRLMADRKPFELTNFVRAYNVYQIISCIYFLSFTNTYGLKLSYGWKCVNMNSYMENYVSIGVPELELSWWYLLLRLSELSETIVFMLRKKHQQISFLHTYHHFAVATLLWVTLKKGPDMNEAFVPFVNTCVHVLMFVR